MNWKIFLLSCILAWSCRQGQNHEAIEQNVEAKFTIKPSFQSILDSANVKGAVLFFEPASNTYFSNDFARVNKSFLPASTFKIANSIVALELGILENESSILKWDSIERNITNWNKDLTLSEAFRYSCVPCYQALARKAGVLNMRNQLDKIEFPGMVFDSSTLDLFWLQGESKISQIEQIDFLQKLYNKKLDLKENTYKTMKSIMFNETRFDYKVFGKTGLAIRDTATYGWYIGYVERDTSIFYFATNITPPEGMDLWNELIPKRIDVTIEALDVLLKLN